jgi:Ca2+/Na+ antiporter
MTYQSDSYPTINLFLFILLILIFVLYLFSTDDTILVTLILLFVIFAIYFYYNSFYFNTKGENFILDENENEDITLGYMTERERRIRKLNATRGKTGQFYVPCHKCGRDRILQERRKMELDANLCPACLNNGIYCLGRCIEPEGENMHFFNSKYIDVNATSCYDCILDKEADKMLKTAYREFPTPVNGPP